jgi:hypothetical protein
MGFQTSIPFKPISSHPLKTSKCPDATINGVDGWTVAVSPEQWYPYANNPMAGLQSLLCTFGSAAAVHTLAGETFYDGSTVSELMRVLDVGAGTEMAGLLLKNNVNGSNYAGLLLSTDRNVYSLNATGDGWVATGHTYALGDILNPTMTFNFTAQTWGLNVINQTNALQSFSLAGLAIANSTSAAQAAGTINLSGWFGQHDNVGINVVPEPSTFALLGAAGFGLLAFARRTGRRTGIDA